MVALNWTSWYGLAGNALWISGLAVLLATLSMVRFQARVGGARFSQIFGERGPQMAVAAGLILFCAGLLLCSDTVWERGIWGVGVILVTGWLFRLWRRFGADRGEGA